MVVRRTEPMRKMIDHCIGFAGRLIESISERFPPETAEKGAILDGSRAKKKQEGTITDSDSLAMLLDQYIL